MDDPRRGRREAAASRKPTSSATAGRSNAASTPRIRCAASCRRWAASFAIGRRRKCAGGVRVDTGVYEGGEIPMYYDSMIAKLVVHAPSARGSDRADDGGAERVRDPRHRVEHRVPVGAGAASAFRGRAAHDRVHRRGVSERIPRAGRAAGQSRRSWRPWRRPCIAPIATAPRASSGRCRATRSTSARTTSCWPPDAEYAVHARSGAGRLRRARSATRPSRSATRGASATS